MINEMHPFTAELSGPRGLWHALVEADAARTSRVEEAAVTSGRVIDLAAHAQAHLAYLERVAGSGHVTLLEVDAEATVRTVGSDVVIDLAEHRSRRTLIA